MYNEDEDVEMDVWHTRREKIKNDDIGSKVRVASMEDKMREVRLRWFRHV